MSRFAKIAVAVLTAAIMMSPAPSSARRHAVAGPLCESVAQFADGSWMARAPLTFGRGGTVEAGAIVYKGTVVGGVDVGSLLNRNCIGRYTIPPPIFVCYNWFFCSMTAL